MEPNKIDIRQPTTTLPPAFEPAKKIDSAEDPAMARQDEAMQRIDGQLGAAQEDAGAPAGESENDRLLKMIEKLIDLITKLFSGK